MAALYAAGCLFWSILGALLFWPMGHPIIGAIFGWLLGAAYWLMSCWASEKFALDLYGAEILTPELAPNLVEMVQELSTAAGLEEPPMLYTIAYSEPNAFALCRPPRSSVIVVTNGLTMKLNRDEVRAVMALMVARLADRDASTWSLAATLAGLPLYGAASEELHDFVKDRFPADGQSGLTVVDRVLLACIVPPCAVALRLAYDPNRLAEVDRRAAMMVGNPEVLASALAKIGRDVPHTWWGGSTYNPATAYLFAVPPVSQAEVLDGETSDFCRRAQAAFSIPFTNPDERQQRLLALGA